MFCNNTSGVFKKGFFFFMLPSSKYLPSTCLFILVLNFNKKWNQIVEIAKILNHCAIHGLQVNTTFERWKKKIGQMMIMRSHTTNIRVVHFYFYRTQSEREYLWVTNVLFWIKRLAKVCLIYKFWKAKIILCLMS